MRYHPYSRRFTQFNQSALKAELKILNIAYVPLPDNLGAHPLDRTYYLDGIARYDLISATEAFEIALNPFNSRGRKISSQFNMCGIVSYSLSSRNFDVSTFEKCWFRSSLFS